MPTLTVSMPAYNTEKFIRESIESVLRQKEVDFELVVVDDASSDNTAEIVKSFQDPRVRLLRNHKNMGIGYCHNQVIRQSESIFIAHVDSDDVVLPGAFQKMVQKLQSDPELGQVHCHWIQIDEEGKLSRESFHSLRKMFRHRTEERDYRRDLILHGCVINHLRTYRREVFDRVGYFGEKKIRGTDYEMALRLVDKYKIGLVPEFLYCHRRHTTNISKLHPMRGMKAWSARALFGLQLLQRNEINFLSRKEYASLILRSFYYQVLKFDRIASFPKKLIRKVRKKLHNSNTHLGQ